MSQADANSLDGDDRQKPTTTGTGCYKNYDHMYMTKNRRKSSKAGNAPGGTVASPQLLDVAAYDPGDYRDVVRNLPGTSNPAEPVSF